jgi:hypothetical protein
MTATISTRYRGSMTGGSDYARCGWSPVGPVVSAALLAPDVAPVVGVDLVDVGAAVWIAVDERARVVTVAVRTHRLVGFGRAREGRTAAASECRVAGNSAAVVTV